MCDIRKSTIRHGLFFSSSSVRCPTKYYYHYLIPPGLIMYIDDENVNFQSHPLKKKKQVFMIDIPLTKENK